MSDVKYNLIFRGQISPGSQILDVKRKISHLLKLDDAKVELLFDGRTTILKRNLSKMEVEKYKAAFDATGAVSVVEPVGGTETLSAMPPQPPLSGPEKTGEIPLMQHSDTLAKKTVVSDPAAKITCPKCGAEQAKSATCIRCGVIFAKVHEESAERPPINSAVPEITQPPLSAMNNTAVPGTRKYGIGSWVILLIGCCCLAYAAVNLTHAAIFVRSSREATGKVIGFASDRSVSRRSRSTTYAPEVDFREPGGRLIRFRSKIYSNIVSYQIGDSVPVRFDPGDPHHAEINAFVPVWGLGAFLLVFGFIFALVGWRMIRIQSRAENAVPRNFIPEELAGAWMFCPKCGTQQPEAKVCAYCQEVITAQQRERTNRWLSFFSSLSAARNGANANGRTTMVGKAIRILPPIIAIAIFAWRAFSMYQHAPHGSVPFDWRDDYHKVAITVPTDWQLQSTKKEAITPLLQGLHEDRFYVIAKSKKAANTFWAMGISGIGLDHFRSAGWEGIIAETGRTNQVKFSDMVKFNGLMVYRLGYDFPEGYREDAYFETANDLMVVCFVLPKGDDGAERVSELRSFVMTNLTGI